MKNVKCNKLVQKLIMLGVGCCFTAMSVLPAFASAPNKKPMPPGPPVSHHQQSKPVPKKPNHKPDKPAKPVKPAPAKPNNKPSPKPMPPHHNSYK